MPRRRRFRPTWAIFAMIPGSGHEHDRSQSRLCWRFSRLLDWRFLEVTNFERKKLLKWTSKLLRFHCDQAQSKPRLRTLKIRSPPTRSFDGSLMTACCRQEIRCELRK